MLRDKCDSQIHVVFWLYVCTMYLGQLYEYLFNDYDKLRNLKMNKLSVVILLPRELKCLSCYYIN